MGEVVVIGKDASENHARLHLEKPTRLSGATRRYPRLGINYPSVYQLQFISGHVSALAVNVNMGGPRASSRACSTVEKESVRFRPSRSMFYQNLVKSGKFETLTYSRVQNGGTGPNAAVTSSGT